MDLLGKDSKEYIDVMKIPVVINVVVSLIGLGVSIVSALMGAALGPIGLCLGVLGGLGFFVISVLIGIASAIYVGYIMAKNKSGTLVQAFCAGALLGLIVGVFGALANLVGSVLNIVLSVGTLGTNILIALLALIAGPIISIIIGGICGLIGGVIGGAK